MTDIINPPHIDGRSDAEKIKQLEAYIRMLGDELMRRTDKLELQIKRLSERTV